MAHRGPLLAAAVALMSTVVVACAKDSGATQEDGSGGSAAAGTGGQIGSGPLRIGTFNARNVFNDRIDGEPFVLDEAKNTLTAESYETKLHDVATILAELDADVLMLQEIENRAVLDDLADRPELGRSYPYRVLVAGNDPRGVDVALLSSVPVSGQESHRNEVFPRLDDPTGDKYKYARDVLEIHVRFGGLEIVLLGVHFKAKRNDNPDKRLAEAQHTRLIADGLTGADPSRGVLILGDFNDFPGSPARNAIDGTPPDEYTGAAEFVPDAARWTVESSSAPGGLALHDDLVSNGVMTPLLDPRSVVIVHDDELSPDLAATSDHAPVAATYVIE